jgi:hypothetical protein
MADAWREHLLHLSGLFQNTSLAHANMRHVALLSAQDYPDPLVWQGILAHEGRIRTTSPLFKSETGWQWKDGRLAIGRLYGSNKEAFSHFVDLADKAYRVVLDSPHRDIAECVRLPHTVRDYSPAWLATLYEIAKQKGSLIRAERAITTVWSNDWDAPENSEVVGEPEDYAWLENNVYLESIAAIRWLLDRKSPVADGPFGGKWLRWKNEPREIPTGVVYNLVDHMWTRDAARYDDLIPPKGEVLDSVVDPSTMRSYVGKVNEALKPIGVPWRLKADSRTRHITKRTITEEEAVKDTRRKTATSLAKRKSKKRKS